MSKPIQNPSGPLSNQLSAYQQQSRTRNPELALAYDALVQQLSALDADEVGPKIGERMPPFVMPDEHGRLLSLGALLEKGPAVISFNRGHWCPYCKIALRSLSAQYPRIESLGASVVAIMPDLAQFTADHAATNDIPFPILSDIDLGYSLSLGLIFWVGWEVEQLYREAGILLDRYHGNQSNFLPIAATFIVDQDGIVRARRVNLEFRERMEPTAILSVLADLRGD